MKDAADRYLPLKPHWFYVLLVLADAPQHGYGIMQDVLERTGGKTRLWPPTLYGTIKRLIEEDLIEPSGGDSRRRNYRITPSGRRVLAAACARLEDLIRAVHALRGARERRA